MSNKESFQVLSLEEERKLIGQDLKQYYQELRKYILHRKLTNTTLGATTVAPKMKNEVTKIAEALTKKFTDSDVEWICDGKENIPAGTILFAHSHQGILDNFVWMPHIDRHCLILHGQEVNKLLLMAQLCTGLVLVRKGDKENNHNAKLDLIRLLLEGHSITYFPEGTWNLSPNKLHLPLSFGFVDVAKKAQVPIVPVVHEYTYDTSTDKEKIIKIHSRFGKPIYVSEEDDLLKKLAEYEEAISTIRYELMMEKGTFNRSDITNYDYINFLKGSYRNLALGKLNVPKERAHIFGAKSDFYLFHHINDVPFNEKGELLPTDEVRKIKKLNIKHQI